tara:strand:- start:59 stop:967 length:909 start_codon:yes stop_codon:yes gene_type:complete
MKTNIPSDKAHELIEKIDNGEFKILTMSVDEIKNIQSRQVRFMDDPEMVKYIAEKIDKNGGSVDMTDPIKLFTAKDGKREIIGGNHTKAGILSSKKATEVKYIDFGNLSADGWSDAEIRMLGILLNPREEKRRNPSSDEDFVKTLLLNHETDGIEIASSENLIFLLQAGCSDKECTRILRKAHNEFQKKKAAAALNGVWKTWVATSTEAREVAESYTDSNTVSWLMSSLLFDWRKIMDKIVYNPNKRNLCILIHHRDPDAEKNWNQNVKPMHTKLLDKFLVNAGYTYELIELPTIKSETESV